MVSSDVYVSILQKVCFTILKLSSLIRMDLLAFFMKYCSKIFFMDILSMFSSLHGMFRR